MNDKTVPSQGRITIDVNDTGSAMFLLRLAIHKAKPQQYAECLTALRQLDVFLMGKIVQGVASEPPQIEPVAAERYLSVEQVCERFQVTPRWLYRHKARLPHSQPSRKQLIFPEKAVTKWFASRKAA